MIVVIKTPVELATTIKKIAAELPSNRIKEVGDLYQVIDYLNQSTVVEKEPMSMHDRIFGAS